MSLRDLPAVGGDVCGDVCGRVVVNCGAKVRDHSRPTGKIRDAIAGRECEIARRECEIVGRE